MRYLSSSLIFLSWLAPVTLLAQAQTQTQATTTEAPLLAVQLSTAPRPTLPVQAEEVAPLAGQKTPDQIATAAPEQDGAPVAAEAAPAPAQPAMVELKGKVLDEKNNPLIGATVYVKGASIAASTDAKGEYTLKVPAGVNSLLFSYMGYEDKVMESSNFLPVNVSLAPKK